MACIAMTAAALTALAGCGSDDETTTVTEPGPQRSGPTGASGASGPTGPRGRARCAAGYSKCLDADALDYDCAGGEGDGPKYVDGPIRVSGSDPFDLDRDGNGLGCEF
jgi:hypothetical protein